MPMIPEAIISMHACARLGAAHSVVFGGFSAIELGKRIKDVKPKLIITASAGKEGQKVLIYKPVVDEAIKLSEISGIQTVAVFLLNSGRLPKKILI